MAMIESKDRATSDPGDRKDVIKQIEKEGVEYVLFWFTDIEGHLKSFAITPSRDRRARSTTGWASTARRSPASTRSRSRTWSRSPTRRRSGCMPAREGEAKVGRMICDVVKPDGEPYEGDPRYVLRRALDRMQAMGFDTFNIGPELEYFLFRDNRRHRDARRRRLLRDDRAGRRDRAAQRDDPGARVGRHRRSSTTTTRSRRRSTRSTCATHRRSTWPTRRSPTG